ncbi:hypothetical protein B0H16DRAFT_1892822 [Mycena metata]|uniref:F-box domain-containing protein n=1 Tax=Mycena metata TaxID=1033252 RepID=A0AAD7I3X2_9AGAR|nr:hypothetical protein B0H16DRAFT_1892822 [Mycena metata]
MSNSPQPEPDVDGHMSFGSMPFDLLSRIFCLTIGSLWFSSSRGPYVAASIHLAHVNRHWRLAALSSALIWNSFNINRNSNLELIVFCLHQSQRAALHLDIDFSNPGRRVIREIMDKICDHLPRVETLVIRVGSALNSDVLGPIFSHACLGRLRILNLGCGPRQMRTHDPAIFELTCGMSHLRSLRIERIHFALELASTFRCLRVLVFRNINPRYGPSMADWRAISIAVPGLERVAILNVGCRDADAGGYPIAFRALTHLDLVFAGYSHGVSTLVSRIYTPSLRYLSVTAGTTESLQCLTDNRSNLAAVKHLALTFEEVDVTDAGHLFDCTPLLRSLDLRHWDMQFLLTLNGMSVAGQTHPLCKDLTTLFINSADPEDVRSFMLARMAILPQFELKSLLFRQKKHRPEFEEDMEWIRERVEVLGSGIGHSEWSWLSTDFYVGLNDYVVD